jgi:hypothetical protein
MSPESVGQTRLGWTGRNVYVREVADQGRG